MDWDWDWDWDVAIILTVVVSLAVMFAFLIGEASMLRAEREDAIKECKESCRTECVSFESHIIDDFCWCRKDIDTYVTLTSCE